jgi:hypothetical protein
MESENERNILKTYLFMSDPQFEHEYTKCLSIFDSRVNLCHAKINSIYKEFSEPLN